MELVLCNNGKATTTSLKVAEYFNKPHNDVLKAIRKLLEDADILGRGNFSLTSYATDQNKELPMYEMDRDGFTLLAMGFTGKKALTFKMNYIDAFNKAEEALKTSLPVIHDPKTLALMQLLAKTDALEFEQSQQRQMIENVSSKVDSLTPIHSMHILNSIQGAIQTAAKWYRSICGAKHVIIKANESVIHITTMLLDREGVSDIGYIKDPSSALQYLRKLSSKYQGEYNAWLDRNSLFSKGASI